MNSHEIRRLFLDFFRSKAHKIVPSAPLVNKDDPTLMFTNSGMVQFKDYFLGNKVPDNRRIADTQKCLRVSGKHNDLEDVGMDGTHHTLFEMLGNWSFGDYFKEEAIAWSWELLTEVYKLPKDRLYATVFGGDSKEQLPPDDEALAIWRKYLPDNHILYGNKKDNFWEMGEMGPCGPCSEIHIDLRTDAERAVLPGEELVNKDHPRVIEIWNNVFMQFNRKADASLEPLPDKHVDTGMGFERLCMVIQGVYYTYDTDIFTPIIRYIEQRSGKTYGGTYPAKDADFTRSDVAMRVVADHIRAVAFTIADGELPSSNGAGYVIRRILRRAVRYYFSFLDIKTPFLYTIVPMLADAFRDVFPELKAQQDFVTKVIHEEEKSFLRTLEEGLKRLDALDVKGNIIDGQTAFELYDTYGFPIDLTTLIAHEKGLSIDEKGFEEALASQRERSRADAKKETGDWVVLSEEAGVTFVGYDTLEVEGSKVIKYRTVRDKKGDQFQIVLNRTPFYAEGGGQVGDRGNLYFGAEKIEVLDTKKENDLIIHYVKELPANINRPVLAEVNAGRRRLTENNHSATHLLHAALRKVLGAHVHQKGSYLDEQMLRFDFSHFQKVSEEELTEIERIVNEKIRENIHRDARVIPMEEAKQAGAMMLFGEKYGETVRMVTFDPGYSRELCGGCHVPATGQIGLFKITGESAIAAGVRRIEALTALGAEHYVQSALDELHEIRQVFNNPKHTVKSVLALQEENKQLRKEMEKMYEMQAQFIQNELKNQFKQLDGFRFLAARIALSDAKAIKSLAHHLQQEAGDSVIVLGSESQGKPQLTIVISERLTREKGFHAGKMVGELAKTYLKGGGGGQAFFATAGGTDMSGLDLALEKARLVVS